jgi:arylsulfatase A-like enzyme
MKPRSLVLVTVDCLRADHVGFLGYSKPVTPCLDSLAARSVVFADAIVAGAPTYFSFPAILASRYALAFGRDIMGIAPHEPTITSALKDAGYKTAAFVAGNAYLSSRFGYDQGFDTFHDFLDSIPDGQSLPSGSTPASTFNRFVQASASHSGLSAAAYEELYFWYCRWRSVSEDFSMDALRRYPAADVIVDQACSWLHGLAREPFFIWLHLMDPHHPYYPPEAASFALNSRVSARRACFLNSFWNRRNVPVRRLERYREEVVALYDAGIYWADQQISRLVSTLKQSQLWDDSVFAVTADHGEEFLEHGGRYHSPTSLSEQLIHVPLLLHVPILAGRQRVQTPFSLLHLAPTLLDALTLPAPANFQGRSFWPQIVTGEVPSEPVVVECVEACTNPFRRDDRMRPRLMAVRDQSYKLVLNFGDKVDRLYDLKNDPGEHSPLPPGDLSAERARLLRVARKHLQRTRQNQTADLRLRSRLRELQHSVELRRLSSASSEVAAPFRSSNVGPTK